jgi:hypothetical protein
VERRALSPKCRFINTELGKQFAYCVIYCFHRFIAFVGWLLLLGYPLLLLVALIGLPHTLAMVLLVCFWFEFATIKIKYLEFETCYLRILINVNHWFSGGIFTRSELKNFVIN